MKKKLKVGALIALIIGLAIVFVGYTGFSGVEKATGSFNVASPSFKHSYNYAASYRFGADFYTEMYGVTHDILSQLNDISSDLESNFKALSDANIRGLSKIFEQIQPISTRLAEGVWLLIMAIGAAVAAVALCNLTVTVPADYTQLLQKMERLLEEKAAAPASAPAPAPRAMPESEPAPEPEPAPAAASPTWVCSCGEVNDELFCINCGKKKPEA